MHNIYIVRPLTFPEHCWALPSLMDCCYDSASTGGRHRTMQQQSFDSISILTRCVDDIRMYAVRDHVITSHARGIERLSVSSR